jgi:purine nucleosidase
VRKTPAVLCALLLLLVPAARAEERAKVLLDTDIGTDIDDAWALGFVVSHPGFEPLGITVTDGDTAARARLAAKLLHVAGHGRLPVAVGRATRVPPGRVDRQLEWAEDFTARRPVEEPAADFIVRTVRSLPGQVTLIAVGPLQNVADALRREPRLPTLVRRLVLMSGCLEGFPGQQGPIPEWNVAQAIADAQLVYGAGFPLTIVPLDATMLVQLREDERERLRRRGSPLTDALESLYRLWLASPTSRMTLHDQLAVAEAARPGGYFEETRTLSLRVDDAGLTRVDPAGRPVTVCLRPRRDLLLNDYLGVLESAPAPGRD